ncbi:MAG: pilus assembly protein [Propionibacteriaceae bacterium]|nr:pilus assembly protein [Propionibacteriaceae bacterium]
MKHPLRDERGSAAVEITLVAPVLVLFILVVIFGGRLALARQAVQSAAFDAARAASLARTQTEARTAAAKTASATLANQQLPCATTQLDLDTTGFDRPVGTPATITVRLVCDVATGDLGLPGILATIPVDAEATSPLDVFRERK